jgi:hypothetical protein
VKGDEQLQSPVKALELTVHSPSWALSVLSLGFSLDYRSSAQQSKEPHADIFVHL